MTQKLEVTETLEGGVFKIYSTPDKFIVKLDGKVIITATRPIMDYDKDIESKIQKYNEKLLKEKNNKGIQN